MGSLTLQNSRVQLTACVTRGKRWDSSCVRKPFLILSSPRVTAESPGPVASFVFCVLCAIYHHSQSFPPLVNESSRMLSAGLLLSFACTALSAPAAPVTASAYVDGQGKWSVKFGVQDPAAVSWGVYTDMEGTDSGFGQLSVSTSSAFPDVTQMYGAGYLEAALTQPRIWTHANNTLAWISSQFKGGVIPQVVINFFTTQDQWKRAQFATNTSDYWVGVKSIVNQLDGLVAGYTQMAPANETLSAFDIWSVGAIGDYLDLITALTDDGPDYDKMTDTEFLAAIRKNNHCSALVKVTGDLSELFFAHVAWFIYQSTTRIFKHYNFALNQAAVAGRQMSFSSVRTRVTSSIYTLQSSLTYTPLFLRMCRPPFVFPTSSPLHSIQHTSHHLMTFMQYGRHQWSFSVRVCVITASLPPSFLMCSSPTPPPFLSPHSPSSSLVTHGCYRDDKQRFQQVSVCGSCTAEPLCLGARSPRKPPRALGPGVGRGVFRAQQRHLQ